MRPAVAARTAQPASSKALQRPDLAESAQPSAVVCSVMLTFGNKPGQQLQVNTLRELHRMALERPDPAAFAGWAVSAGLLSGDQRTRFLDRWLSCLHGARTQSTYSQATWAVSAGLLPGDQLARFLDRVAFKHCMNVTACSTFAVWAMSAGILPGDQLTLFLDKCMTEHKTLEPRSQNLAETVGWAVSAGLLPGGWLTRFLDRCVVGKHAQTSRVGLYVRMLRLTRRVARAPTPTAETSSGFCVAAVHHSIHFRSSHCC